MSSQLKMQRPRLDDLPPLSPQFGSTLRAYEPGDEHDWARIMNECIDSGWTGEKCVDYLINKSGYNEGGCFFATWEGRPEATAAAYRHPPDDWRCGYVHMVGTSATVRGKGLGRLVTLATLHWFAENGFERARLETDDWRLPAISLYLKLGFVPQSPDASHEERWADVFQRLEGKSSA